MNCNPYRAGPERAAPGQPYWTERTLGAATRYRHNIQQIDGYVVLYEIGTEDEIIRFDPTDADATARAQKTIHDSDLSDEAKVFAHFWSGYFHAHGER